MITILHRKGDFMLCEMHNLMNIRVVFLDKIVVQINSLSAQEKSFRAYSNTWSRACSCNTWWTTSIASFKYPNQTSGLLKYYRISSFTLCLTTWTWIAGAITHKKDVHVSTWIMNKSQTVVCVFSVNGALEPVGPLNTRLETSLPPLIGRDEGKICLACWEWALYKHARSCLFT